ncbi:serine hydrolase [Citromicrobium bathyomarinum]|uniref:serine hydrolase n=1 Tax=Citromicrobium bathyomarinum TaxID=72174 RepID=UPI001E471A7D|nr:serine hydrolase [Citromicrobium bathyomarinum]
MQMQTLRAMMLGTALAVASVATTASPAYAQAGTEASEEAALQARLEARADDVIAVINGEKPADEVFAPAFLAQVSPEQFTQISQQMTSQFGAAMGVETVEPVNASTAKITLRFEKALASGPLGLQAQAPFLIETLLLQDFQQLDDGPDKIDADIAALSGSTAAWFGPLDGEAIYSYGDPAKPYALGSAFKLYVLAALSRAVSEGRLAWDDVVPLDAKSFPSGIMQTWPDGTPVTLQTAAILMISISDNTATDLVMRTVGRDAVEAEMRASGHAGGGKTLPFLTTREMFSLKAGDMGEAYAAADVAERRAMLETLDSDELTRKRVMEVFTSGTPVLIEDIEWFASMRDELGLMRLLADLPEDTARRIMSVNTALSEAEREGWSYVGYKGGSEAGVRNLSWLLRDGDGRWYMLAISQMDPASEIDTTALLMIAKRILTLKE